MLRKQLIDEPSPTSGERFFGVVLGEVQDNHELADTPSEVPLGRVKVAFPSMSGDTVSDWAPCARPMGGDGMGFYALPEKGEQVLVAFEHGDLSKPYVLGSLWHVGQSPPEQNTDGQNTLRMIKSKAGHTIMFDDTRRRQLRGQGRPGQLDHARRHGRVDHDQRQEGPRR